ncbi:hypothetical protein ASF84_00875 [Pseudomonas sp. Leaf127]|uniref:PspA/IM30 family protein n=1 Tax=Pseudomonas TaxID=286 RepID=UPI0007035FC5|nr:MULTISPECIES: PspA/IM30 family protein [Pseudomonas]KQQ67733.1 hypothetical protein ASF84_00875 [Pseudomonas sp. Leaf127]
MGLIWTKILIALRGRGHDVSDTVMADQALRLLDRAVGEAEEEIGLGRSSLANLMTKHILASRETEQTAARLAELAGNAGKALALGHDHLALELAAHIGRLERVQVEDKRVAQQYGRNVDTLRLALEKGENALRALKRQIDTLRINTTRHAALPACDTIARLQAAADALDIICQHQREVAAQLEARNDLCTRDPRLEKLLCEPVIIPDESSAYAVLARIKSAPQPSPGNSLAGGKVM